MNVKYSCPSRGVSLLVFINNLRAVTLYFLFFPQYPNCEKYLIIFYKQMEKYM